MSEPILRIENLSIEERRHRREGGQELEEGSRIRQERHVALGECRASRALLSRGHPGRRDGDLS
ncbi:MAG TPA: hypothetical protein VG457_14125, partial [Planctomycetota bacterium]|nr:hypothetical protein [Planctomycetota bacterium]